jgi:hypothetical protein
LSLDPEYVLAWARAFAFTQIVEAPIYRQALRVAWWRALAPTALTHPFVWFAFPLLSTGLGLEWTVAMALAELFAWLVEAAFFVVTKPRVPPRRALLARAAHAWRSGTRVASSWACVPSRGRPGESRRSTRMSRRQEEVRVGKRRRKIRGFRVPLGRQHVWIEHVPKPR